MLIAWKSSHDQRLLWGTLRVALVCLETALSKNVDLDPLDTLDLLTT